MATKSVDCSRLAAALHELAEAAKTGDPGVKSMDDVIARIHERIGKDSLTRDEIARSILAVGGERAANRPAAIKSSWGKIKGGVGR